MVTREHYLSLYVETGHFWCGGASVLYLACLRGQYLLNYGVTVFIVYGQAYGMFSFYVLLHFTEVIYVVSQWF